MLLNADPRAHGAALEALRRAHEDLRLVYSFCPDLNEDALDDALHSIARVSRRVFESRLRGPEGFSQSATTKGLV